MTFSKESTHHAYGVVGDIARSREYARNFLANDLSINLEGNPDVRDIHVDTFSIADAREIDSAQQNKSFGDKQIFIISFDAITVESQNALLKMFEEPTAGTHFFILLRSPHILLDTVRSRLEMVVLEHAEKSPISVEAFITSSIAQRLSMLDGIIKEKNKGDAIVFVRNLEEFLYTQFTLGKDVLDDLRVVARAQKYINDRGASLKILLEYIAVTLGNVV